MHHTRTTEMYIIPTNQQSEHNRTVQKLHLRDVMEYIIDADENIQIIKMLSVELKLTPISKAKDIIGKSYNGIKQFGKTIKLGGKIFAILK